MKSNKNTANICILQITLNKTQAWNFNVETAGLSSIRKGHSLSNILQGMGIFWKSIKAWAKTRATVIGLNETRGLKNYKSKLDQNIPRTFSLQNKLIKIQHITFICKPIQPNISFGWKFICFHDENQHDQKEKMGRLIINSIY